MVGHRQHHRVHARGVDRPDAAAAFESSLVRIPERGVAARGGETWAKWYKMINDALVNKATVRGDTAFWDPNETGLEGGRSVGPIYTTSVYTMMLAMPYHYIPLYQR